MYNQYYLNQTGSTISPTENTKIETEKKLKLIDYFDYVYSYPPKIKIKWEAIDELNEDLFIGRNYGVLEHSFPFMDFLADLFFNSTPEEASPEDFSREKHTIGFFDKVNSSNFFIKKTKEIQNTLEKVPVFVLVNGHGEIVLSKPSNIFKSNTFSGFVKEKIYDFSGSFDPLVEKRSQFGMFFLDSVDAKKYLEETARADFQGTQTVGLSIQCISLKSAYKITREYHPGIDFRFIPNFEEIKELLEDNSNYVGKSDILIEDEQQQLRFRPRIIKAFPNLKKLGSYLRPTPSFLRGNEYFKGVPVYIVQITNNPDNFLIEQYFKLMGVFDNIYSGCVQHLDNSIGFGHNWIMQGSIQDAKNSKNFENYIFFEKKQAIEFRKQNARKAGRYIGSRTANLDFFIRKPKILVYNLEDFLEDWEDNILAKTTNNKNSIESLFNCKNTYFIPSSSTLTKLERIDETKQEIFIKNLRKSITVKFRVLKNTVGVFFRV